MTPKYYLQNMTLLKIIIDTSQDPYVSAATESGAPSRAAYKLVEINDKHGVLAPGDR